MARPASAVLRPLPRQVKPFPKETAASYFGRLAHANRLDPQALRTYITADRRRGPVPIGRLSVVTGLPGTVLRQAIPDLDGDRSQHTIYLNRVPILRSDYGPPCRWCVLARGITQPVWCWKHPEEVICLRHRRWIGPTASAGQQPDLRALPAILQAHKRHLRLVRRFGRDEVALASGVAEHICRRWHEQRDHDAGFQQHMRIFHGPGWRVPPASPAIAAAIYPQVIALTRLLASPYWLSLAAPGDAAGQERYFRELRQTVAPAYAWPQPFPSADPLHRWLAGHRLSQHPPAAFAARSAPALM